MARPPITETEVRERLAEAVLHLGQAELLLHHVPLHPDEPTSLRQPEDHGTIGSDVPGEFDFMIDLGDGHLFISPPDHVHCS